MFLDGKRIFIKAEASSYQEASLFQCEAKVVSEAFGRNPLEAAVSEYYTSGPGTKEADTIKVLKCPRTKFFGF